MNASGAGCSRVRAIDDTQASMTLSVCGQRAAEYCDRSQQSTYMMLTVPPGSRLAWHQGSSYRIRSGDG